LNNSHCGRDGNNSVNDVWLFCVFIDMNNTSVIEVRQRYSLA